MRYFVSVGRLTDKAAELLEDFGKRVSRFLVYRSDLIGNLKLAVGRDVDSRQASV